MLALLPRRESLRSYQFVHYRLRRQAGFLSASRCDFRKKSHDNNRTRLWKDGYTLQEAQAGQSFAKHRLQALEHALDPPAFAIAVCDPPSFYGAGQIAPQPKDTVAVFAGVSRCNPICGQCSGPTMIPIACSKNLAGPGSAARPQFAFARQTG